jgi:hypothetical protein
MISAYKGLADSMGIDISNQIEELEHAAAAGDVEKIEAI